MYNINNAGSLSAGQRAALASSSNIAAAQAANAIHDKTQEVNNGYRAAYADALMKYGQDEATRLQQANAYQQEAYRQAVGAQQKLKAQARKNWYTLGRQALQDYNTMLNTRGMLKLWNAQQEGQEVDKGSRKPYKANKKLAKKMAPGISVADLPTPQEKLSEQAMSKVADQIRQDRASFMARKYKQIATDPRYTYLPYRVDLGRGINGRNPSDLERYIAEHPDPARWLYMDAPEGYNPYGWRVNKFRDALKGYIR